MPPHKSIINSVGRTNFDPYCRLLLLRRNYWWHGFLHLFNQVFGQFSRIKNLILNQDGALANICLEVQHWLRPVLNFLTDGSYVEVRINGPRVYWPPAIYSLGVSQEHRIQDTTGYHRWTTWLHYWLLQRDISTFPDERVSCNPKSVSRMHRSRRASTQLLFSFSVT